MNPNDDKERTDESSLFANQVAELRYNIVKLRAWGKALKNIRDHGCVRAQERKAAHKGQKQKAREKARAKRRREKRR